MTTRIIIASRKSPISEFQHKHVLKMERGCVEDQPQRVGQADQPEISSECCGWSRTTQPRSGSRCQLRHSQSHQEILCWEDMRLIGHLQSESQARTFADFLYVQGIDNQLEFQRDDGWAIWVRDEDKLEPATKMLSGFRLSPSDPRYHTESKSAPQLRAQEEKNEEAYRKKLRGRRNLFRPLAAYGFGPLTFVFIVACVIVFIWSRFANDLQAIHKLFISEQFAGHRDWQRMLPEVRSGEVWRLFTPAFIHLGFLHILFNMLWLRDLGGMIEGRQGTVHLLVLVLALAGLSDFGQYYVSGPIFGGMSGVVYGLLGYIWIRGKFDPGSGLFLHPSTVNMMLIWFVLCYTNFLGPVANTAHAVGLVCGMAWGYLSSLRHR